ncbi:MAG: phosphoglucomutase [Bacteroidetes bacterium GWE2_29_8]|nr:MAG: phosphoglucomutase [Bacteroidetes bacterium GWE2_29_8]OFY14437.1 MAG: phosphoglucomutase [Bacteroidetes bacterium GWF2_29_10]
MNNQAILDRAKIWLNDKFDTETRKQVEHLIQNNQKELNESFYQNLEFGTGGLRGIMGVGTNRMNIYTVGMATQGFANYLKKEFNNQDIKVAIAYDCRNNSKLFAQTTANVFSANGFTAYLFETLRPTPELSYTIRKLGCMGGVVITASHNPKEYNGYKAYWNDGSQLVSPHDKNVVNEVAKISNIDDVKFNADQSKINIIGKDLDDSYIKDILKLSISPQLIQKHNNIKIVYSALHGTGSILVPRCLKAAGFKNIHTIKEQDINDGNFPTVKSPNPEEGEALTLALIKAKEIDADIVMATDPDADRVGIAIKNNKGEFILLNGNQTGAIIMHYILTQYKKNNLLKDNDYIVSTIVTSEIIEKIAKKNNVEYIDVLTGFKYIAEVIRVNETTKRFIAGCEESYGYLIGDDVRDKDAISACFIISEIVAWAKENQKTMFDILIDIYKQYGLYIERLLSITKKGIDGLAEIKLMMDNYRLNPPETINKSKLITIKDYLTLTETNIITGEKKKINLEKSNVLQYFTADGSKISVRPSGTEPKIKFYFSVNSSFEQSDNYYNKIESLNNKISNIITDLKLDI